MVTKWRKTAGKSFQTVFHVTRACNAIFYLTCYTECPRRNVPNFGRVFLMLKYTDITQNTYVQIW